MSSVIQILVKLSVKSPSQADKYVIIAEDADVEMKGDVVFIPPKATKSLLDTDDLIKKTDSN